MTDTTTIEITDEQREWLEEHKEHPKEPVRAVVDALIRVYEDDATDTDDGEIPPGILEVMDATPEQLRAIRDAVETVESRTGRIERQLDDLEGRR